MDIPGMLSNIPNWILISIFTFFLCYLFYKLMTDDGVFKSMGVPYPKPIPLLGNLLHEFTSCTHTLDVEYNKKYGRVYGFYETTKPVLRVSDPVLIKEILVKQFNNFSERRKLKTDKLDPMLSKMVSMLSGKEWKMARNVMTPTFTSGRLKQMISLINKCSASFVDMLAEKADNGETVEAKDIYIATLLEVTGSCVFGVELNEDNKSFLNYAKRVSFAKSVTNIFLTALLPKKIAEAFELIDVEAKEYIRKAVIDIIKVRESGIERRNDFLQIMVDILKEANTITSDEMQHKLNDKDKAAIKTVFTYDGILSQCVMFLVVGYQSMSTALRFISYCAAAYPDHQEKLIEEVDRILLNNKGNIDWDTISQMTYMDKFVMEALRMYPATTRIGRECTQDTQIGKLFIKKGMFICIPIYAIHHDEEFYPDSFKFDPERFSQENKELRDPYTFLSFGIGPRNCIGMRFALMEIKIILINIFKNFRIRLAPEAKTPLVFKKGSLNLLPTGGIPIRFVKRNDVKQAM